MLNKCSSIIIVYGNQEMLSCRRAMTHTAVSRPGKVQGNTQQSMPLTDNDAVVSLVALRRCAIIVMIILHFGFWVLVALRLINMPQHGLHPAASVTPTVKVNSPTPHLEAP